MLVSQLNPQCDKRVGTERKPIMRSAKITLSILGILACTTAPRVSAQTTLSNAQGPAQKRIMIAASTVLDGKGHVLHNTHIVVEGSKIVAIDSKAGPVDYDLRGLTVLPGWIDAHAHVTWIFGKDGCNAGQGGTTPDAVYAAASNAYVTLMAGFTTVQSIGSLAVIPLREAIANGTLPGPRILTLAEPLFGDG